MKRLLIGTAVAGALGVVAWGGVAMVAEVAASRWLEDRRAEGWVANVSDISVSGFPAQFVTAFQDVELTDPDSGFAWSVASFEVRQDILRLDRIEVHWPTEQVIASRVERLTIRGMDGEDHPLIATLDVQPINRVALDAVSFETGPMQVISSAGWQAAWQQGRLTVDRVEDAEATYDLVALTTMLAPPDAWRALLDPAGALPAAIDTTTVRARARFDAPWNMDALGAARPQVSEVQLEDVSVRWGDMLLRTTGTLNVTPGGVPEGELAVRAENWAAMMDLANTAGLVPEQFAVTADAMLEMLAGLSGEPEHIDTTLLFANGRMLLGGVLPIGPAPNLHSQ